MDPILTIVVPTYNMEAYLAENLRSLLLAEDAEKVEILIVDNDSTDRSREIAAEFERNYPAQYRLIHKENHGYGSSINLAIDQARGTYLRIVDADDWLDPEALKAVLPHLETKTADLWVMDYTKVDQATGQERMIPTVPRTRRPGTVYAPLDIGEDPVPQLHATIFYLPFLRNSGIRLLEDAFYVDEQLMILSYALAESICYLPHNVYRYRIGNQSQSVSGTNMALRHRDRERVICHYWACYRDLAARGAIKNDCTDKIAQHMGNHFSTLYALVTPAKTGRVLARQWAAVLKDCAADLYCKIAAKRWILFGMNLFGIKRKKPR